MPQPLTGRRVLVVEDEYFTAVELARMVANLGGEVLGPVGRLSQARLLACGEAIDAAVLDVKLNGETSLTLVEELLARGIPLILATGYGSDMLPERFAGVPRLSKPYRQSDLAEMARRHLQS